MTTAIVLTGATIAICLIGVGMSIDSLTKVMKEIAEHIKKGGE